MNSQLDANAIVGSAVSPEVMEAAGANDADMVIAVTQQDEINMVACQVAHSLFNVPKKDRTYSRSSVYGSILGEFIQPRAYAD